MLSKRNCFALFFDNVESPSECCQKSIFYNTELFILSDVNHIYMFRLILAAVEPFPVL